VAFAVAFDRAQERMQNRFTEPLWNLRELLPSVGPKQRAHVKVIRDFGRGIIEQKRAEYAAMEEQESTGNEKADLLTMLMSIKNEDGESPTDEQLCDYVLNFIIAGISIDFSTFIKSLI
jgi:cytochrome P450